VNSVKVYVFWHIVVLSVDYMFSTHASPKNGAEETEVTVTLLLSGASISPKAWWLISAGSVPGNMWPGEQNVQSAKLRCGSVLHSPSAPASRNHCLVLLWHVLCAALSQFLSRCIGRRVKATPCMHAQRRLELSYSLAAWLHRRRSDGRAACQIAIRTLHLAGMWATHFAKGAARHFTRILGSERLHLRSLCSAALRKAVCCAFHGAVRRASGRQAASCTGVHTGGASAARLPSASQAAWLAGLLPGIATHATRSDWRERICFASMATRR
jgi:hypothetical protein